MGRSLGSMPAIEVAVKFQDEISGLIIESGLLDNFRRLCENMGIDIERAIPDKENHFRTWLKYGRYVSQS